MNIPLAQPDIGDQEREAVLEVLSTHDLSLGPKLEEFEENIAEFAGVKYAVAVNSGTSALHLIIKALGIGEGDEVITTPFSFIASANCILFEQANPVFVDIDPKTLNIDVDKVEAKVKELKSRGSGLKAILAVDVFGQPADWDRLQKIAGKYNLKLIEDSAEALGAEYKGKKAGGFGEAAVFAFYPNKQITTGEGGVVLTNNPKIAELCRSMRNQGRHEDNGWLEHKRLGYNYRLSDINCALGIAQLERIKEILKKRDRVAQMYNERLKNVEEVEIPYLSPDIKMSWFVYVIRLGKKYTRENRDQILQALRGRGISCNNYFSPIHLQPFYREQYGYKEGDFPITEYVSARTVALPFYNNLTEEAVDYIVDNLKDILKAIC